MKEEKPKPISIRPKTQAERDHYIAKGGAKWFHAFMLADMGAAKKAPKVAKESK
jgi:hypothetical protein